MAKTKLLFVCESNQARSPTAEWLMDGDNGYYAQSCGVGFEPISRCTPEQVRWADRIFVFDRKFKPPKRVLGTSKATVEVLKLPHIGRYWEPCENKLIQEIKKSLEKKGIHSSKQVTEGDFQNSQCMDWVSKSIGRKIKTRKFN